MNNSRRKRGFKEDLSAKNEQFIEKQELAQALTFNFKLQEFRGYVEIHEIHFEQSYHKK